MKHAQIDTEGRIIAFLDDAFHDVIPQPSVRLTAEQYALIFQDAPGFRYDYDHQEFRPYAPKATLSERKATALAIVKAEAARSRSDIASLVPPERLTFWAVKTLFAVIGRINDGLPEGDGMRAALMPIVATADEGFAIEAEVTGQDVAVLQTRTFDRAAALFLANQLIEGMERVAEAEIAATTSETGLDITIESLRARQVTAEARLAGIITGATTT